MYLFKSLGQKMDVSDSFLRLVNWLYSKLSILNKPYDLIFLNKVLIYICNYDYFNVGTFDSHIAYYW